MLYEYFDGMTDRCYMKEILRQSAVQPNSPHHSLTVSCAINSPLSLSLDGPSPLFPPLTAPASPQPLTGLHLPSFNPLSKNLAPSRNIRRGRPPLRLRGVHVKVDQTPGRPRLGWRLHPVSNHSTPPGAAHKEEEGNSPNRDKTPRPSASTPPTPPTPP